MSYTYVARSSLTSSLQVFKETITNKWREEIQTSNQDISSPMLEYIISELRDKAEFYKKTGGTVVVYEFGIVKSDFAVPEATRLALMDAVHVLEKQRPWTTTRDQIIEWLISYIHLCSRSFMGGVVFCVISL
jgi:hypothetical protein